MATKSLGPARDFPFYTEREVDGVTYVVWPIEDETNARWYELSDSLAKRMEALNIDECESKKKRGRGAKKTSSKSRSSSTSKSKSKSRSRSRSQGRKSTRKEDKCPPSGGKIFDGSEYMSSKSNIHWKKLDSKFLNNIINTGKKTSKRGSSKKSAPKKAAKCKPAEKSSKSKSDVLVRRPSKGMF